MADERAMLSRAKEYLIALSDGINPLTGAATDDSILAEERLRKCFSFVASVIERDLARIPTDGGTLFREGDEQILCADDDVPLPEFLTRLNETLISRGQNPIPPRTVNNWLIRAGFAEGRVESVFIDRKVLRATERSSEIGIFEKTGVSAKTGALTRTLMLSDETQRWLIRHLPEILSEERAAEEKKEEG